MTTGAYKAIIYLEGSLEAKGDIIILTFDFGIDAEFQQNQQFYKSVHTVEDNNRQNLNVVCLISHENETEDQTLKFDIHQVPKT